MFYRVGVHRVNLARTANTLVVGTGSHVKSYNCDFAHVNVSAQVVARQKFIRMSSNSARRTLYWARQLHARPDPIKKNRATRGLSVVVGGRTAICVDVHVCLHHWFYSKIEKATISLILKCWLCVLPQSPDVPSIQPRRVARPSVTPRPRRRKGMVLNASRFALQA